MRRLGKQVHFLGGLLVSVSRVMSKIGMVFLALMALVTTVDVFLRNAFDRPIAGIWELTEFMMIVVVYLGVAYTQHTKTHVSVDLLVSKFPPRAQAVVDSFTCLLSLSIFCLISWRAFVHVQYLWSMHKASEVLEVPVAPFVLLLAIGCVMLCFMLLADFINLIPKMVRR